MDNERIKRLKEKVARLPLLPGVYRFFDKNGTVIYVGKAKSLRKRVSSYFVDSRDHSIKVRVMVRHIVDIKHIVVDSESDALLLENSLIKSLQPRYNVLLKDDKTYPWIAVTAERFPRIISQRRVLHDGTVYFGPYASVGMQHALLDLLHGLYPIRTCALNLSQENIDRGKYRPCLQYHIHKCKAPCAGYQSQQDYDEMITLVKSILRGDLRSTRQWLEEQMMQAASQMLFEEAERYRQKLEQLENYSSKSVIVSSKIGDLDVFSLLVDEDTAYCNFVRIVSGSVVNTFTVPLSTGVERDEVQILSLAMQHIAEQVEGGLAREAVVPFLPDERLFPGVAFSVPKRGDKLKLLEFSQRGARIFRLETLKNMEIRSPEKHASRIMETMRKELGLDRAPRHIECFDNSNLQGSYPVASCVVFRNGKPSKKEYRHFNIKTVDGIDDYASMQEVVRRRYTRLSNEGAELPDLIIADGGKGQMEAVRQVVEDELGLKIPIAGLAKDDRHRTSELLVGFPPRIVGIKPTSMLFRMLMNIQDEVHRFAITFHRNKRSKDFIHSELEKIDGIGAGTVEKLLARFKTVAAVRRADMASLVETAGKSKAAKIYAHFHPDGQGA